MSITKHSTFQRPEKDGALFKFKILLSGPLPKNVLTLALKIMFKEAEKKTKLSATAKIVSR